MEDTVDADNVADTLWVVQLTSYGPNVSGQMTGDLSTFGYCIDCYHRARVCTKRVVNYAERVRLLAAIERTAVRYAIITLQQPDLFPGPRSMSTTALVVEQLLRSQLGAAAAGGAGLTDSFLTELVTELNKSDPGDLARTFGPVITELQTRIRAGAGDIGGTMGNLGPLLDLVKQKSLRPVVVNLKTWHPPQVRNGMQMQLYTFLGPIMTPSLCPSRANNIDEGPFRRCTSLQIDREVAGIIEMLDKQVCAYQTQLHQLVLSLLSSKDSKKGVLDWIESVVRLNKNRQQLRYVHAEQQDDTLSEDGFMLNVTAVLLRLCEKYSNPADKKVWPPSTEKIDSTYLHRPDARIDVSGETLLGESKAPEHHLLDSLPPSHGDTRGVVATAPTPSPFSSPSITGSNFVTESFYLTLSAIHVGAIPVMKRFDNLYSNHRSAFHQMIRMQQQLKERGVQSPMDERRLQDLEREIAKESRKALSISTHLFNEQWNLSVLNFYAFVCEWILSLVDPDKKGLPLAETVPATFAMLPEHFVEDIAEFLQFSARNKPQYLEGMLLNRLGSLARFMAIFIGDQQYIRNPYITSRFVAVLGSFTPEAREKAHPPTSGLSPFFHVILREPTSVQHLAPALMRYFVNMEETDPYARVDRRRDVAVILKSLWNSQPHRAALVRESETEQFDRFVMLLINEAVDHLDEGRKAVEEARAKKEEMESPDYKTQPEQQQREIAQMLDQWTHTAKYYFDLGIECVNIFAYLTTEIVEPILRPELISRLSYLVNFNLVDLVQKASHSHTRREYENVGIKPGEFLLQLVNIYLQVAGLRGSHASGKLNSSFVEAVARDGRSFKPDVFRTAVDMLRKAYPGKEDTVHSFLELIDQFEKTKEADDEMDADLGDIPDEFLDPIMATLMEDPVQLPSSKQYVDRSTIQAHLLTNPRDPFNRAALRIEEVIDAPELRDQIRAWVASRRQDKRS